VDSLILLSMLLTATPGDSNEVPLSAFDTLLSTIPFTGISVGGLVMLIVAAYVREWVYPRGAMIAERTRHAEEIKTLETKHAAEMEAVREENRRILEDQRDNFVQQITILREDRDARLAEGVERAEQWRQEALGWREAHGNSEMEAAVLRNQNGELLELARTSEHVLRSLPQSQEAQQKEVTHDVG